LFKKNYNYVAIFVFAAAVTLVSAGCRDTGNSKKSRQVEKSHSEGTTQIVKKETARSKPPVSDRISVPDPVPAGHFPAINKKRIDENYSIKNIDKPSVILLVTDATSVKHLSAYGYHRDTTPNIAALADQGIIFTNYVSNSSWTRPSFTTIITGLPKKDHGVELANRDVRMDITTLAEHFRMAGYKTGGFVGNPLVRGVWGFNQGYQEYVDTASIGRVFPPDGILFTPL
jgi:hypothetical protein